MHLIYIAGPFRGSNAWKVEQNIRIAEEAALTIAGWGNAAPLCPHSMYRYFNGTVTDDYWLRATTKLLERCDAIYLLPLWHRSEGSKAEHEYAKILHLPVFKTLQELEQWVHRV